MFARLQGFEMCLEKGGWVGVEMTGFVLICGSVNDAVWLFNSISLSFNNLIVKQ